MIFDRKHFVSQFFALCPLYLCCCAILCTVSHFSANMRHVAAQQRGRNSYLGMNLKQVRWRSACQAAKRALSALSLNLPGCCCMFNASQEDKGLNKILKF